MTDKGASGSADARQSPRFLYLYALAVAGGSLAYIPFLTLLLPLQVTGFAKASSSAALPLDVLAYASFAGAVAASLANILFGWASDVTRRRRPWIAAGLILSSLLLIASLSVLALSAALLLGCATPSPGDYAAEKPTLQLRDYLNGPLLAHGLFTDRSGRVVKRFTVELVGRWQGASGVLEVDF